MKIDRVFTAKLKEPYEGIEFEVRLVEIRSESGVSLFSEQVTVPKFWSQNAVEVLASKYFRRNADQGLYEKDLRQAIDRMAGAWTQWGEKNRVFSTQQDAQNYYDEMRYQLVHQIASPNSPQWFNTGVHQAYGIEGPRQGLFFVDEKGETRSSPNSFEHPQVHACFIQSVADNLVGEGGIWDLWLREARLFKFGSGSGTNYSALRGRGESLSGGGTSSGVISFLKVGDTAAGAVQSGGTNRRAAKMVSLDIDHPDILEFIQWKVREERKVACLIAGSQLLRKQLKAVWDACSGPERSLALALDAARQASVPEALLQSLIGRHKTSMEFPQYPELDFDWRNEAYQSVSGQNANNSVLVSDAFWEALQKSAKWALKARSSAGKSAEVSALELWDAIVEAAWECADPGVQFESTIAAWHTCPNDGQIRGSNPCSEYFFLNDTACNLASLNLLKFFDSECKNIFPDQFGQAVRLWVITLDISVSMAGYPSKTLAERSLSYRTLGLGFANLGALLMRQGVAYGSPESQALTAAISAWMTGEAYATSAELAREMGPFSRFEANRTPMLAVINKHMDALSEVSHPFISFARTAWAQAMAEGAVHGFRNAQVTAIAPTGTIGIVMDCDTMGIEPEYALVKSKRLAGGGALGFVNQSMGPALRNLGYSLEQVRDIEGFVLKAGTVEGAPHLKPIHFAVFDCAAGAGSSGHVLSWKAHLAIVAAAQPFISGGISKTVNLPNSATVQDVRLVYENAHELGLKAISVYRSGCKLSEPLKAESGQPSIICAECG